MSPVTAELVGKALTRRRKERDLTQAELGELVGVSGSAVGQWEQGRTKPGWRQLQKLAEALDVPIEFDGSLAGLEAEVKRQTDEVARLGSVVEELALLVRKTLGTHVESLDADATPGDHGVVRDGRRGRGSLP